MLKTGVFVLLALATQCCGGPSSANHLLSDRKDISECIRECPRTRQYDPICGNNGVEYWNPAHLFCAQYCGIDVIPTHPPPCSSIETTTEKNIEQCILECRKTSEYNPVCGSDGKQYFNESTLRCAQQCGVDVKLTHPAPCQQN